MTKEQWIGILTNEVAILCFFFFSFFITKSRKLNALSHPQDVSQPMGRAERVWALGNDMVGAIERIIGFFVHRVSDYCCNTG